MRRLQTLETAPSNASYSRPEKSQSPMPPTLGRRRSSILSYSSLEEATQSFTDDIIHPSTNGRRRPRNGDDNEVTHWHSTPLAFAILPAIGGLFFQNGSLFVTDILLLGLAAIFMNWSIRLPWDWYYSAQEMQRDVGPPPMFDETIAEEPEPDDIAVEDASSAGDSPAVFPADRKPQTGPTLSDPVREQARTDLRRHELLALLATFVFPALAAYLLHVIRAQLSRPSTQLVSDYNLSIFLLAAEIRPFRQLARLISSRTLYLQRTVSGSDEMFDVAANEKPATTELMSRIADLEARLSDHTIIPPTLSMAQKNDISDLSAEMKRRYEPRLEGLERAVRRYEKRSTTLAMLTEQRLQTLENRTNDALSLAAAAAQHSQSRGVAGMALNTASNIAVVPLKMIWSVCMLPINLLEDLYVKAKTLLLGPGPPQSKRKNGSRYSNGNEKFGVNGQGRKFAR